jgi:membrane fusion protein, multidrug efflux system
LFAVENGVAKKKYVTRGYTSGDQTEIVEGLIGTEVLVDKGFREVGDNFSVTVAKQ